MDLLVLSEDVIGDLDLLVILYHGLDSHLRNGLLSEIVVPEADIALEVYIGKALVLWDID